MPRAPITRTYSKKSTRLCGRDALNALFAENLQKREIFSLTNKKKSRKASKIQLKELPPPDKYHHLIEDSVITSALEDTFDRLLKSSNPNLSNSCRKGNNVVHQQPDIEKTLDKSVTNSLIIEKEPLHKKEDITSLSSFSDFDNTNVLRDIRHENCSIETSYEPIFSKKFKEANENHVIASTPAISYALPSQIPIFNETISPIIPVVQKSIIEKSYDVINAWNFKTPKEFQSSSGPSTNTDSTPSIKQRSYTGITKAKHRLKHTYKNVILNSGRPNVLQEFTDDSVENDVKLKVEPKVVLTQINNSLNILGITCSVQLPSSSNVTSPLIKESTSDETNNDCEKGLLINNEQFSSPSTPVRYINLRRRAVPVTSQKPKLVKKINYSKTGDESHSENDNSKNLCNSEKVSELFNDNKSVPVVGPIDGSTNQEENSAGSENDTNKELNKNTATKESFVEQPSDKCIPYEDVSENVQIQLLEKLESLPLTNCNSIPNEDVVEHIQEQPIEKFESPTVTNHRSILNEDVIIQDQLIENLEPPTITNRESVPNEEVIENVQKQLIDKFKFPSVTCRKSVPNEDVIENIQEQVLKKLESQVVTNHAVTSTPKMGHTKEGISSFSLFEQLPSTCKRPAQSLGYSSILQSKQKGNLESFKKRWTVDVTPVLKNNDVLSFSKLDLSKANYVRRLVFGEKYNLNAHSLTNSNIIENSAHKSIPLLTDIVANANNDEIFATSDVQNTFETETNPIANCDNVLEGKRNTTFSQDSEIFQSSDSTEAVVPSLPHLSSEHNVVNDDVTMEHAYSNSTDSRNFTTSAQYSKISGLSKLIDPTKSICLVDDNDNTDEDDVIWITDEEASCNISNNDKSIVEDVQLVETDVIDLLSSDDDEEEIKNTSERLSFNISRPINETDTDLRKCVSPSVINEIDNTISWHISNVENENISNIEELIGSQVHLEQIDEVHENALHNGTAENNSVEELIETDVSVEDRFDGTTETFALCLPIRKPLKLKDGKSWRRSLLQIRKQSQLLNSTNCEADKGCSCSCTKSNSKRCKLLLHQKPEIWRKSTLSTLRQSINTTLLDISAENDSVAYGSNNTKETVYQERSIGETLQLTQNNSIYEETPCERAKNLVLRKCGQEKPLPFQQCYSTTTLQRCRKIGEGVYGEVFLYKNSDGYGTVMKIIPIEGSQLVNDEPQKKFSEILSEIVIAVELSNLRYNKKNNTTGFSELKSIKCVQGCYPERLIDLWDLYDETHKSENDSPEMFREDQLYIILELSNGGIDMESFEFKNACESFSLFKQIACSIAVAEEAFEFEHRDLHWGNVLISKTDKEKLIKYTLNGHEFFVPSNGIEVSIIDFTLSRVKVDSAIIYNDISKDPDLFSATGEYQFEIYKLMQQKNNNEWEHYEPYTNVLWMHYILHKMIRGVRYMNVGSRVHKSAIQKLVKLKNSVLKYSSVQEIVNKEFL